MTADPTGWPDEAREQAAAVAMRAWLEDALRKCHAGRRAAREKCSSDECEGCAACDEYRDADIQAMCYSHALDALSVIASTDAFAAALAQARRDALEEAARIADPPPWMLSETASDRDRIGTRRDVAAAIRAKAQEAGDE
jgi:hypothetical protein